jgi:hypothetical protein
MQPYCFAAGSAAIHTTNSLPVVRWDLLLLTPQAASVSAASGANASRPKCKTTRLLVVSMAEARFLHISSTDVVPMPVKQQGCM